MFITQNCHLQWKSILILLGRSGSKLTEVRLVSTGSTMTLTCGHSSVKQLRYSNRTTPLPCWLTYLCMLQNLEMSGADRSSLLDDIFSLADGNYLNYTQALDFAKYLSTEDDYIAWSTASSKFLKMLPFIKTKLAYTDFKVRFHLIELPILPSFDFLII